MPTMSARWLLIATGGLALAYWAVAVSAPDVVGMWQDDAIYVVTAQSLAEGNGYRHVEIASQPLQTKYPVLYPALLAPVFWLVPSFPDNRALLLLPTALAGAALLGLCVLYWQRVLRESGRFALALGALAALAPALVGFVRYTMSEFLYAALAMGALVCLDWLAIRDRDSGAGHRWLVIGGALVGLALLTRSVGLALVVAAIGAPLLRRRPADALVVAGAALVVAAPWWIWRSWAAALNGTLQTRLMEAPELGYAIWLPGALGETLRVVQQNFFRGALGLGYQLGVPADFVRSIEADWRTLVLHVVSYTLVALVAVGFVRSTRSRPGWRTLHLYALAYAVLVLAWPFPPQRFLVPWVPFVIYFLVVGVRAVGDRIGASARLRRGATWAGFAIGALIFLHADLRILASTPESYAINAPASVDLGEIEDVAIWLRRNTGDSDVIASAWPAGLFLRSGRRGHFLWPDSDPYTLFYGPDRSWWAFYAAGAPSENRALLDDMRRHLVPAYHEAGIDYYVEFGPGRRETAAMARIVRATPQAFELRYETPRKTGRIFRIRLPPFGPASQARCRAQRPSKAATSGPRASSSPSPCRRSCGCTNTGDAPSGG